MLNPRCYIWVIAILLFSCIISGGTFLMLYMILPATPTTSYYPVVGIVLVCLPWFFWVLTMLYRILSRSLGFRMICWGDGMLPTESMRQGTSMAEDVGGLEDGNAKNNTADGSLQEDNTRQVQFGNAVVLGEQDKNPSHEASYGGSLSSIASHESQSPLKLSMAS
ncbi:uncharacterized protein LOC130799939 [Amaranthus tricolor]|uniref:uncharacterized protein LOC130799939 n=1 Tax=Amaranthus tricolor TaxID=29722 RepID=UPI0025895308|nr:uncharacterized protein LOC130799939 [Amaranthus tricolor]